MLFRDNLGNRIHAGRVVREVCEPFIDKNFNTPFKLIDYKSYCNLRISGVGLQTKIYQDIDIEINNTYSVNANFKMSGVGKCYVETVFYNNSNVAIESSRKRTETLSSIGDLNISISNTSSADAKKIRVIIGAEGTSSNEVQVFLNKVEVINVAKNENIIKEGFFENWTNNYFPNWNNIIGSGGYIVGRTNYYPSDFETSNAVQIFGEGSTIKSGIIFDKKFKLNNFREINFTVEGFNFPSDISGFRMLMADDSLKSGFGLVQQKGETTCKIVVYHADGTFSEKPIPYQIMGGTNGNEIKNRRNLTITVYPFSKMIYVLEYDQVIYCGVFEDLVVDKSCVAKMYADSLGSDRYSVKISQAKIQFIHN